VTEQPPPGPGAPLQFDQVELPAAAPKAVQTCAACRREITDIYYAAGGALLCASCAEGFKARGAATAAFPTAVLYGAVAALAGTLVWYFVMKISGGHTFGILAIVLASGLSDVLGLLILAIALYEAWKINRPLVLSGPFRIAS
jgi:hypothetical protein